MTLKNIIEKRRSVRKFKADEKVPKDLINELIDAARLAPSACNAQPSRFILIEDDKTKELLKENNIFRQAFVYEAPLIIVCLGDASVFPKERLEKNYGSFDEEVLGDVGAIRDVAIATQNLVLMATELGLGTCYIGLVDRKKIKEILEIPQNYVLPFVIITGYPAEEPKSSPRKSVKEVIIKNL
ncbi:MAG: nitroreductase family protein [Candidatus Paceibacterota bacterium]|jgi:nitroreductase